MLEANYRSHRELLKIPSKMFYNDRLTENADRSVTHSLLKWDMLPQRKHTRAVHQQAQLFHAPSDMVDIIRTSELTVPPVPIGLPLLQLPPSSPTGSLQHKLLDKFMYARFHIHNTPTALALVDPPRAPACRPLLCQICPLQAVFQLLHLHHDCVDFFTGTA